MLALLAPTVAAILASSRLAPTYLGDLVGALGFGTRCQRRHRRLHDRKPPRKGLVNSSETEYQPALVLLRKFG